MTMDFKLGDSSPPRHPSKQFDDGNFRSALLIKKCAKSEYYKVW
jgi:hypothetical protein